jgi:lysylphosphatidylglycerol synthetase-like protein (DUF2156 family)
MGGLAVDRNAASHNQLFHFTPRAHAGLGQHFVQLGGVVIRSQHALGSDVRLAATPQHGRTYAAGSAVVRIESRRCHIRKHIFITRRRRTGRNTGFALTVGCTRRIAVTPVIAAASLTLTRFAPLLRSRARLSALTWFAIARTITVSTFLAASRLTAVGTGFARRTRRAGLARFTRRGGRTRFGGRRTVARCVTLCATGFAAVATARNQTARTTSQTASLAAICAIASGCGSTGFAVGKRAAGCVVCGRNHRIFSACARRAPKRAACCTGKFIRNIGVLSQRLDCVGTFQNNL